MASCSRKTAATASSMSAVVTPGTASCAHPVERLGDHPPGLAHQRDLARALQLDHGSGDPGSGPPRRPMPARNEGKEGRGTMPRWENTSLELLFDTRQFHRQVTKTIVPDCWPVVAV